MRKEYKLNGHQKFTLLFIVIYYIAKYFGVA